jgi:CubicO group peptidase (beta-lactamase class C family)
MTTPLDAVTTWPVVVASAGVVDSQGTLATVGPLERPLAWASVTKPVTALATLIAIEEGTVDLEEPAGPRGSTLRHLLAHASGLPPDGTEPIVPPGTRRIYSNTGFEIAAALVARRAGMGFDEYVAEAVFEPLGMAGTRLAGSAATGAFGPLTDLLALAGELLAPTLVSPETLGDATAVAFAGLAGVLPGFGWQDPNDWGLGFELRDAKRPHWTGTTNSPGTFGHFGRSGAFVWVDPAAGLACASLADRPFGRWAAEAWPHLSDAVLARWDRRRVSPPSA